ncbi:glutamate-5-semialdehyde dehydrogenase [Syncephalis pseudoplumigaleata]|uniref:glutamate-5-semialdehyde dehydrogenase n=1 Tax=Syncephalis pseudoplumigaleata TaxID=1712513 RepID=A0A4P9Z1J7_9FUNG|nr:glutamate-5-semialdehyde dehydrogenase [Syncephalis pseudoplumigaleata]|eukprot:RKP26208.1 glutamate-5-semialdehyde dehydrogenase [Syncephalis pseudoplumigaleata]
MAASNSPSVVDIARNARLASTELQSVTGATKSMALKHIQAALLEHKATIIAANRKDKEASAGAEVDAGRLSASLFKRLDIEGANEEKFMTMVEGVADVDKLEDPTGRVSLATKLDEQLEMYRVACPVGVLLVIFEARPEVAVNISALAIKSGNAVILKGGKEATHTLQALNACLREALNGLSAEHRIPADAIQLVSRREEIAKLLDQDKYIDMVIPRGSNALVRHIQNNTRIPVLGHADGLCSIFIDATADVKKSIDIVLDAKLSYPAACNAVETLLVHADAAERVLPSLGAALFAQQVQLRADAATLAHLPTPSEPHLLQAIVDADDDTEFLDAVLSVRVVASLADAIAHINAHGSKHTDAIITEDKDNAELFMTQVDAAGVYWNASTRFADGFRYGFGTEIGVSTNKTHARGPVGLEGLVIYKYRMYGNGQASAAYGVGEGKRRYLHEAIPLETCANRFRK